MEGGWKENGGAKKSWRRVKIGERRHWKRGRREVGRRDNNEDGTVMMEKETCKQRRKNMKK